VEGVGKHAQTCTHQGKVTVVTKNGTHGSYEAPIIEQSDVPALLGLRSMSEKRTLIDVYNKIMYFIGPGGYQIHCSPGTAQHDLETSPSGHLIMETTCWSKYEQSYKQTKAVSFNTREPDIQEVLDVGDLWSPTSPDSM
jgi:hypothetical protein